MAAAKKKTTIEKRGQTPGNRQYTTVKQDGVRKTVVYHPDEGAFIKRTTKGGKSTKGRMGVVNEPRKPASDSPMNFEPQLRKPARKTDLLGKATFGLKRKR